MRQYCDIPKDKGLDNTINILKEGYLFIPNRMNLFNSNIFETHIMAQKAICITGKDAAKVFYNEDLFKRKGVTPKRIQKTLFGENAIQGKDGIAHIKRKSLFMNILTEEYEEKVARLVKEELIKSIDKWEQMEEVILFREISQIICYVVCNCVGIYISREASQERAEDFLRMIYSFSSVGSKYRKGKEARKETEKWIENIVVNLRNNKIEVEKDSPLYKIAFYKDVDNKLLDNKMAAIEIINVIRPIIAVSTYVVFAALALHTHPECREKLIKKKIIIMKCLPKKLDVFILLLLLLQLKQKRILDGVNMNLKREDLYYLMSMEQIMIQRFGMNLINLNQRDLKREMKICLILYHKVEEIQL